MSTKKSQFSFWNAFNGCCSDIATTDILDDSITTNNARINTIGSDRPMADKCIQLNNGDYGTDDGLFN